jgi:hypothetical protein
MSRLTNAIPAKAMPAKTEVEPASGTLWVTCVACATPVKTTNSENAIINFIVSLPKKLAYQNPALLQQLIQNTTKIQAVPPIFGGFQIG